MTVYSKKKILVAPELKNSAMGIFLEEQGFELNYKVTQDCEYLFVLDNAFPDILDIPRMQTIQTIDPKFAPLVRCYFSEEFLESSAGKTLLESYFKDSVEFDLVERYSKSFKNIYTVKIHDYLNVGFFIDTIIVEAYKAQFDITALRNYLHTAFNFTFNKIEQNTSPMPLDVSYSHNGSAFTIQISLHVDGFKGIAELKDVMTSLTENSSFFDVAYFQKTNKLTLSSLIFKDPKLKKLKSHFITEIVKRSLENNEIDKNAEVHSGLKIPEKVDYVVAPPIDEQALKLSLARKFALFIKNYRKNEESPKSSDKLELSDVDHYLKHYPIQSAIKEIDDEIKKFILKLISDDQLFDGISDYVTKISSSNLNNHAQEIQRVLGGKSLSDIDEFVLIKGSPADKEQVERVKGWVPERDDEIWELKRSEITEKIKDEVIRIKSNGGNIIQDDIIRVMAKELNAQENDVKIIVSGIVEEVVSSELIKNQKLEEAFAIKILEQQAPAQVREKLESQITRMKKIMEGLKQEIIKLHNEKADRVTADREMLLQNSDQSENLKLRTALIRTMDALKAKERFVEKMKSDNELLSKAKDQKTEALAAKIEEMKAAYANSKEFANEEKLKIIEAENKSLNQRLDHANKKVNIINENIENRENESLEKREKEVETLKGNLQIAQLVIERFKQDKIEMELRYNVEKEALRKLRDEKGPSGVSKEELLEKDLALSGAMTEKKLMEEKFRAQAIELKKLEQKLKFVTSQLETAGKRKTPSPTGQKSAEAIQKLLDQSNARLAETTSEMAEKRKEVIKQKQENIMMSNRIAELEKKLAAADKKAA